MITLTLNELDVRSLVQIARAKGRAVKGDRAYWMRLADELDASIPLAPLPGLDTTVVEN